MISTAPANILNHNGLYMRLTLINNEQSVEITNLKERIAVMEKDLEKATLCCDTYKCVYCHSISIYAC